MRGARGSTSSSSTTTARTASAASPSGSPASAVEIAVHRRRAKSGLGDAYRDGFAFGLEHGYEVLVQMDADLSHDPAALPALLQAVAEGADLAIVRATSPASIPHWSARRRALSRFGNVYAGFMLNLPHPISPRAFARCAPRRSATQASRRRGPRATRPDQVAARIVRTGRRVVEIPIAFTDPAKPRSVEDVRQYRRRGDGAGHLVGIAGSPAGSAAVRPTGAWSPRKPASARVTCRLGPHSSNG